MASQMRHPIISFFPAGIGMLTGTVSRFSGSRIRAKELHSALFCA
jgi:hypothetical protein